MPRYWVARPVQGRVAISMPFARTNRAWLKETLGARIRPEWDRENKCWWVARNHFEKVIVAMRDRLGRIDVYVDFRQTERCDTRCKNARSRECTCQCLGKHHGHGITNGWKLVTDTTEVRSSGIVRRHFVVVREERKR